MYQDSSADARFNKRSRRRRSIECAVCSNFANYLDPDLGRKNRPLKAFCRSNKIQGQTNLATVPLNCNENRHFRVVKVKKPTSRDRMFLGRVRWRNATAPYYQVWLQGLGGFNCRRRPWVNIHFLQSRWVSCGENQSRGQGMTATGPLKAEEWRKNDSSSVELSLSHRMPKVNFVASSIQVLASREQAISVIFSWSSDQVVLHKERGDSEVARGQISCSCILTFKLRRI